MLDVSSRKRVVVFLVAALLGVLSPLLLATLRPSPPTATNTAGYVPTVSDLLLDPNIIGNPYPLVLVPLEGAQSKVHFTILTPKDLSRLAPGTSLIGVEVIVTPEQERVTLYYYPGKVQTALQVVQGGGMILEEMTLKLDDPSGWLTRYANQFAPDPARRITTLKGHPALVAPRVVMWWANDIMCIITANLGEADLISMAESLM